MPEAAGSRRSESELLTQSKRERDDAEHGVRRRVRRRVGREVDEDACGVVYVRKKFGHRSHDVSDEAAGERGPRERRHERRQYVSREQADPRFEGSRMFRKEDWRGVGGPQQNDERGEESGAGEE